MSESPMAASMLRPTPTAETLVETEADVQCLLDMLDDVDCRRILDATSTEARSASELSDSQEIPRSTLYRKLDLLTEAGLLEERTRIRRSGKHTSEYYRSVEDVVVAMDDEGVVLRISRRETPAPPTPFSEQ